MCLLIVGDIHMIDNYSPKSKFGARYCFQKCLSVNLSMVDPQGIVFRSVCQGICPWWTPKVLFSEVSVSQSVHGGRPRYCFQK